MKILYKIAGAVFVLFIILCAITILITKANNNQRKLLLQTSAGQLQKSYSVLSSVISSRYEMAVLDYTQWNDMCDFIATHNNAWADENLRTMLSTYKVNSIWVADTDGKIIYRAQDKNLIDPEALSVSMGMLDDLNRSHTARTCILKNNTVVEIFGAAVTTSEDTSRVGPAHGYLFCSKIWDKHYLSQIEGAIGSNISIVKEVHDSFIENDSLVAYNEIKDYNGQRIAYIKLCQPASYIDLNRHLSRSVLILIIISALAILTLVIYSLISLVGRPIIYIEAALNGNEEKLEKLRLCDDEYTHVAELIEKSELIKHELTISKEKAEEANKLKTVFLQNMSHEFRTPLNAIIGFSQLIEESYNNLEELKFYSSCIYQSGSELLRFANQVLDASRLDSGKMPVLLEQFTLREIENELVSFYNNLNKYLIKPNVGLSLKCNCSPDKIMVTDKTKLIHILNNLVHNALKFTQDGEVEVGCSCSADNIYTFYVSDTGIGIDDEKIPFIFEKFSQIEGGLSRTYSGSGLGLSIVKSFIELLDGTIEVASVKGKGSRFTITIPDKSDQPDFKG
jgi:signal transduction histidine kinase